MARFSFSKYANFAIHVPLLVLNLLVVGGLVWDMTPDTQSKIFANHRSHVTPQVSLVATSIATLYTVILLLLASFNIIIPALPRIIIDSAILWPAHLTSLIVIGAWNDWSALKQIATGKVGPNWSSASTSWGGQAQAPLSSRQLTCSDPTWTTEMCAQRWKAISIIQTLAFAFGWLCLLLVTIDLFISVRIYRRRRYAFAKGINPDEVDEVMSFAESEEGTRETGVWVTVTHHRDRQSTSHL